MKRAGRFTLKPTVGGTAMLIRVMQTERANEERAVLLERLASQARERAARAEADQAGVSPPGVEP